jgi:hypothetical protein
LYGARNERPFGKESLGLLPKLARGKGHIVYSKPEPRDQLGLDYDSVGRLNVPFSISSVWFETLISTSVDRHYCCATLLRA